MLWYKGWLETRFRLLAALAMVGCIAVAYFFDPKAQPAPQVMVASGVFFVVMLSAILAGAGITTQPAIQANQRGFHAAILREDRAMTANIALG